MKPFPSEFARSNPAAGDHRQAGPPQSLCFGVNEMRCEPINEVPQFAEDAAPLEAIAELPQEVFTATQIAGFLGIRGSAVRKRLQNEPSKKVRTPKGQTATGWGWATLPQCWQEVLATTANRRGYRTPEEMLADESAAPWSPPVPLADVPERFQGEAIQWQNAMMPILRCQHETDPGELFKRALAECHKVFGREISEATWRRHFDLAVKRDNGLEQWGRMDIYLPEEAFQHLPALNNAIAGLTAEETGALTDAFSQVANRSHLTIADRDAVFESLIKDGIHAPSAALDYTFRSLPGISRTRKALGKWFQRKRQQLRAKGGDLNLVKDGRPGRSGRKGKLLCPECAKSVSDMTVQCDGNLPLAWRRHRLKGLLCAKCVGFWHFDARDNKSYVPKAVRDQIMPGVLPMLPFRHGVKFARQNAPYVVRKPGDTGPGDVFEADDMTPNHIFSVYAWTTDDAGRPCVCRGELLVMIDRRTQYPVGYLLKSGSVTPDGKQKPASYSGYDIRLLVLHVHDRIGLAPELLFENGIWKSRLVVGRKVKGWDSSLWRDYEQGLNEEGIFLGAKGVRHALPSLPRTKIIERVFRSVQELMRPLTGFVGFNHREYKPEVLNDFLRRVKAGKENPAALFLSMEQLRAAIDNALMEYTSEPHDKTNIWIPGKTPEEAWLNGIGGFPGMKDKPLRKLPDTARHLLSTHRRMVQVSGKGIRFEVGGRHLVFWGDALIPYKHVPGGIPVRWNLEEPELLHCFPQGGAVFTLKARELNAWTATPEELAETGASRNRWVNSGKRLFDQMNHKLICTRQNDLEHSDAVHSEGVEIQKVTAEYRGQKAVEVKEDRRLKALAGTLNIPQGIKNPERAIAAAQRRMARAAELDTEI